MSAALTSFFGGGFLAPGGFTLQIGVDDTHQVFRLTDKGKGITEQIKLTDISKSGAEILFEFDSHVGKDISQPCHVELRIRLADKPFDNEASWIVTSPVGDTLLDSHNSLGNKGGWVKGNFGIMARFTE